MTRDEVWLDDDQADAWLALVAILEILPSTLDSQLLRDADLTFFEFLVLTQLAEEPERTMRLSELAAATHTTLPRLSRVIGRLEKDGLVVREASRNDARSRLARLTDLGWERLDEAAPGHVELVRRIFVDRLTRDQLDHVRRIGTRLLAALDPSDRVLAGRRQARSGRPGLPGPPTPRAQS